MGLRELKAARSRQLMTETALELFLQHGYDETTMEQIAEGAEVGTSTLYRYFPTKDQLLLDPLIEAIDPTPHLRARPADEPIETALGEALVAAAAGFDGADSRIVEMRALVDGAPVARARLWDRYRMLREDLEDAIADRMGLPAAAVSVRATAGIVLDVFQLVDRDATRSRPARQVVIELLEELATSRLVVPRAADERTAGSGAGGEATGGSAGPDVRR